jgi:hypothetical protein
MLAVFWSPLGFPLVEILLKGIRFDFYYFCSNILSTIVQNQLSETLKFGGEEWCCISIIQPSDRKVHD